LTDEELNQISLNDTKIQLNDTDNKFDQNNSIKSINDSSNSFKDDSILNMLEINDTQKQIIKYNTFYSNEYLKMLTES